MQLFLSTKRKKEIVDITELVQKQLDKDHITDGICLLFVKHTTACITTADLDPGTDLDMIDAFEALMPQLSYRHPHNPSHVTDHILSSIIGPSLMIPITSGQLELGTWQRIVLIELDGPRERKIALTYC